jgi:2-dehydropantoate 2-reductase
VIAIEEAQLLDDVMVLLCTQSQHTASALAAIPTRLPIVCMQNGVANERLAARSHAQIYGAMVFAPCVSPAPGVSFVHSEAPHGVIEIGWGSGGTKALAHALAEDLVGAGFDARASEDVSRIKYGKLLSNLANVLQALSGDGALRHPLAARVVAEAEHCFRALAIDYLPLEQLYARCSHVRHEVVEDLERPGGSTWQSLARASGSIETDFLNGEIIRLGEQCGVPTPVNRALVDLAHRAVRERWSAGRLPLDELAVLVGSPDAHLGADVRKTESKRIGSSTKGRGAMLFALEPDDFEL